MDKKNAKKNLDADYSIVIAGENDAKAVWEIRNSPESRKRSNNAGEVSLESHMKWFRNKYLFGRDNSCFVMRDNSAGRVVGYCRFDLSEGAYLVSIALDPSYHGKGLGYFLLSGAISKFGHPGKVILAEIQKDNAPSMSIFLKNNFRTYKEDNNNFYLKLEK